MPRPVWSGTISFGLVNIPVKMFNSVKNASIRFHQLRKSDGCRIAYKKVCALDGKEVPAGEIVRGFELSADRHVIITDEELAAVYPEATHTIAIDDFISLEEVDPLYYEHTYYLSPDTGAEKAYCLLRQAMQNTQKAALSHIVLRNKEYLAALRPVGNTLCLTTMLFYEEIVDPESFAEMLGGETPVVDRELQVAKDLIETLSANFDPQKYADTYTRKLRQLIDAKTETIHSASQPVKETGKVIDIMKALEASLSRAKKPQAAKTGAVGSSKETKTAKEKPPTKPKAKRAR